MHQIDNENLPRFHSDAFYCPRCKVMSAQKWHKVIRNHYDQVIADEVNLNSEDFKRNIFAANVQKMDEIEIDIDTDWHLELSYCLYCKNYSIWHHKKLVFPLETELPEAHGDMPEDVKGIYTEAMYVFKHSPRASAALLRLAIETMIPQLEEYQIKKASINNMIGELVQQDIPQHVQQGLDAIRIYGNEGIHSGEIVLNEDQETVMFLFELINMMVDELITKKKKIKSFYQKLPLSKLQGIFNRDKQKQKN